MLVNADFAQRALVNKEQYQWVRSSQQGVERVMLDRIGEEKARATSIVRYAPASEFPAHSHPGGEEILVLSGVFSDQHGDFPAGWYIRNPPGSAHQPFSTEGATIFVKLWQMASPEQSTVRINSHDPTNWQQQQNRKVCPLFENTDEQVSLQQLSSNTAVFSQPISGAELLVLSGELDYQQHPLTSGSWLRLPEGHHSELKAGPNGVCFYLKTGPLGKTASGLAS